MPTEADKARWAVRVATAVDRTGEDDAYATYTLISRRAAVRNIGVAVATTDRIKSSIRKLIARDTYDFAKYL